MVKKSSKKHVEQNVKVNQGKEPFPLPGKPVLTRSRSKRSGQPLSRNTNVSPKQPRLDLANSSQGKTSYKSPKQSVKHMGEQNIEKNSNGKSHQGRILKCSTI